MQLWPRGTIPLYQRFLGHKVVQVESQIDHPTGGCQAPINIATTKYQSERCTFTMVLFLVTSSAGEQLEIKSI